MYLSFLWSHLLEIGSAKLSYYLDASGGKFPAGGASAG